MLSVRHSIDVDLAQEEALQLQHATICNLGDGSAQGKKAVNFLRNSPEVPRCLNLSRINLSYGDEDRSPQLEIAGILQRLSWQFFSNQANEVFLSLLYQLLTEVILREVRPRQLRPLAQVV